MIVTELEKRTWEDERYFSTAYRGQNHFHFFRYLNDTAIRNPKDASIVQKKCFIVTGWVLVLNVICSIISCVHYHTIKRNWLSINTDDRFITSVLFKSRCTSFFLRLYHKKIYFWIRFIAKLWREDDIMNNFLVIHLQHWRSVHMEIVLAPIKSGVR